MTVLRPLVIPVATLMLVAVTPSADARTRGPVVHVWVKAPGPAHPTAAGADNVRVLPVHAAITLPFVARTSSGGIAVPGVCYSAAAENTGSAAAGRLVAPTARGPPQ